MTKAKLTKEELKIYSITRN